MASNDDEDDDNLKQQEQIQAALDAALEDLASDEEEEEEDENDAGQRPVMGPPLPPDNEDAEMQRLEHMMQQLMTGGDGGDDFMGKILEEMQAQIAPPQQASSNNGEDDTATATLAEMLQSLAERQANLESGAESSGDHQAAGGADAEAAAASLFQGFMEAMQTDGDIGGEAGAMPDADAVIDGMMEQLLSKELMYEPIQQVTERFPSWLDEHKDTLDAAELTRRKEQYECFCDIVRVYESPDKKDNVSALVDLIQKVQEYGQPPLEIIRELAPGIELNEDGDMPNFPFPGGSEEECIIC